MLLFFTNNDCSLVWATTTKANIRIFFIQKRKYRHYANLEYLSSTRSSFLYCNFISADTSLVCFENFLTSIASLKPELATFSTRNSDAWFLPKFRTNSILKSLQLNLPFLLNPHKNIYFIFKEFKMYFVHMEWYAWISIIEPLKCFLCTCALSLFPILILLFSVSRNHKLCENILLLQMSVIDKVFLNLFLYH